MELKTKLSTLWIFATLNYIYCDVIALMNPTLLKGFLNGNVAGIQITQGFLLASGVLVEIPMAMVVLSRFLAYRPNRWANLFAGTVMTAVQVGSNFIGTPAPYYVFFSIIEVATTAVIVWLAWTWRIEQTISPRKTENVVSMRSR